MALLSLLCFVVLGSSCIKEEYDMTEDNLNLEVTPFQEGLTLPLGETEQIKLADLLKDMDQDVLDCINGAYTVRMNDSFDVSDNLSSLKDLIDIEDVKFSKTVNFRLNDVDVSDVRVPSQQYDFSQKFDLALEAPEIVMPSVGSSIKAEVELPEVHTPALGVSSISPEPINILSLLEGGSIPENFRNDEEIALERELYTMDTHFELSSLSVDIENVSLPSDVESVNKIVLNPDAKVKVSLALNGSLLSSGKVIPDIEVNLASIFDLEGSSDDILHIQGDEAVLSEANGYKASVMSDISGLKINSDDWKMISGCLTLNKSFDVPVEGEVSFQDLKTTTNRLSDPANKQVSIDIKVEFIDLDLEDVEVGLKPVAISDSKDVEMNTSVQIPSEIESVSGVKFTADSGLELEIKSSGLNALRGLEAELSELTIIFPEVLKVDGAVDNRLIVKDVDLLAGYKQTVKITGIELPEPVNGTVTLNEKIEVKAEASVGGNLHTADLSRAVDGAVLIDVKSNLVVEDYNVTVAGYDKTLDIDGKVISVELPEALSDLEEIIVYPKGNPVITIDMAFPVVDFDIVPSAQGLTISFPEMLKFKNLPDEYNYSSVSNTITFKNALPTDINLPIEKLVLTPVQDEDGKYYAKGRFDIAGGVSLNSATLNKAQIEDFANGDLNVSVVANIPEIVPDVLDIDNFETNIHEEFALDLLSAEDMPAEVVSLGLVELKDTKIDISLNAPELRELGSSLTFELAVAMPEIVKVSGVDLNENGSLVLSGRLDQNGVIRLPSVNVDALDLTGCDLKGGIRDNIVIDGTIKLADASLDIDKWLSKDLEVDFDAAITNIDIERLTGKVNYAVDPVIETVDLGDVAGMMNDLGAEANLDFNHAHLALEVVTDLEVRVAADIELVPYYNGKADADKAVTATLILDPENASTKYWLANNGDRCPDGYTPVSVDILGLIKNIPEKLELRLTACTDPEYDCVLEPAKDYSLVANYLFELPLEFGEEFEITYRDTIPEIPAIVGALLAKGNKVKLAGEIENALPLALDLRVNFLDSNGNVIPAAEGCCTQKINSCGLDASVSKTPLDITVAVRGGVKAEDITALELVFNANSGDAVGVAVTDQAYLKAMLKVILPEGVTVDLKDLMNNEE